MFAALAAAATTNPKTLPVSTGVHQYFDLCEYPINPIDEANLPNIIIDKRVFQTEPFQLHIEAEFVELCFSICIYQTPLSYGHVCFNLEQNLSYYKLFDRFYMNSAHLCQNSSTSSNSITVKRISFDFKNFSILQTEKAFQGAGFEVDSYYFQNFIPSLVSILYARETMNCDCSMVPKYISIDNPIKAKASSYPFWSIFLFRPIASYYDSIQLKGSSYCPSYSFPKSVKYYIYSSPIGKLLRLDRTFSSFYQLLSNSSIEMCFLRHPKIPKYQKAKNLKSIHYMPSRLDCQRIPQPGEFDMDSLLCDNLVPKDILYLAENASSPDDFSVSDNEMLQNSDISLSDVTYQSEMYQETDIQYEYVSFEESSYIYVENVMSFDNSNEQIVTNIDCSSTQSETASDEFLSEKSFHFEMSVYNSYNNSFDSENNDSSNATNESIVGDESNKQYNIEEIYDSSNEISESIVGDEQVILESDYSDSLSETKGNNEITILDNEFSDLEIELNDTITVSENFLKNEDKSQEPIEFNSSLSKCEDDILNEDDSLDTGSNGQDEFEKSVDSSDESNENVINSENLLDNNQLEVDESNENIAMSENLLGDETEGNSESISPDSEKTEENDLEFDHEMNELKNKADVDQSESYPDLVGRKELVVVQRPIIDHPLIFHSRPSSSPTSDGIRALINEAKEALSSFDDFLSPGPRYLEVAYYVDCIYGKNKATFHPSLSMLKNFRRYLMGISLPKPWSQEGSGVFHLSFARKSAISRVEVPNNCVRLDFQIEDKTVFTVESPNCGVVDIDSELVFDGVEVAVREAEDGFSHFEGIRLYRLI